VKHSAPIGRSRAQLARGRGPAALAALLLGMSLSCGVCAGDYVHVPAGRLRSALTSDADSSPAVIDEFEMRTTPVTKAEFGAFLVANPQWQRTRVAKTFADAGYLLDWGPHSADRAATGEGRQPVTNVSWFAAEAFCESEQARLPTWLEWEYVAAADATRRDARDDPAWLAHILAWYSRPSSVALPTVGGEPDLYGVRDMHGVIWEWVDDFNALLVSPDSRAGNDPDKLQFCGAAAINLQERQNYAVLMRIALLSSLGAADSTKTLGFRCARPIPKELSP
jgi:sulfatase modifying factor 1